MIQHNNGDNEFVHYLFKYHYRRIRCISGFVSLEARDYIQIFFGTTHRITDNENKYSIIIRFYSVRKWVKIESIKNRKQWTLRQN